MNVKCIAIGNRIMGDDSIGIRVAEEILCQLRKQNIEVIFGETDTDYALSKIEDGDFLFILDSTYFNTNPGTITVTPIKEANGQHQVYSQHQPNLIDLLRIYQKSVGGVVIGVEVEKIHFSLTLSHRLNAEFSNICEEIYRFIDHTIGGINHA